MKRKTISLIVIFLLMLQLASPVLAVTPDPTEVKICSAYWDNDTLYTFAKFSHEDHFAKYLLPGSRITDRFRQILRHCHPRSQKKQRQRKNL